MLEGTDSPEDRLALRRTRRWRRRARIVAPFFAVTVVLGLLVLSVDLIEYQPASHADRPDAPLHTAAPEAPTAPGTEGGAIGLAPGAVLSVSVVESPLSEKSAMASPSETAPGVPPWSDDPSKP
jgi:hypothetical protein